VGVGGIVDGETGAVSRPGTPSRLPTTLPIAGKSPKSLLVPGDNAPDSELCCARRLFSAD
jgi:hypothetical protein